MEIDKVNFENERRINIIDALKQFQAQIKIEKIQELYSKKEKYLYFLYAYADKHIKIYLQNYNKKAYLLKRRNLLYLKKIFHQKQIWIL